MGQCRYSTYQKALADLAQSLEADSGRTYEQAHEWAKVALETIEGFTKVAQGVPPEQLVRRPQSEFLQWPGTTAGLKSFE